MFPDLPEKKAFIPAVIGAGICLFIFRSGFLSLFFLVPLGYVGFRFDYIIALAAWLFAALGNAVLAMGVLAFNGLPVLNAGWDLLYFAAMSLVFTLIIAPPPSLAAMADGAFRLIAGSCIVAIIFTGIFFHSLSLPGFSGYVDSLIKSLISMYRSSGTDVVQIAQIETLNPDGILDTVKSVMLRGGSLVSCIFLYALSRQVSLLILRLPFRRTAPASPGSDSSAAASFKTPSHENFTLAFFHVNPILIWVFSAALLLVVLTRILRMQIPEIILWNILVLCVILYLAQGLGIIQFLLSRSSLSPFLKLGLTFLMVFLLFSPFLNMLLLGGFFILGIIENWVPLRALKKNAPPSTPEAGDDV